MTVQGPTGASFRRAFDAAMNPRDARNALGIIGTGGSGGAPTSAEYITGSADATLTNERVLTNTATVTWDLTTPGQAKANAVGGGNVSNSGTPASGQYAKWVTSTAIQGVAPATVLSDIGAQPAGSYQPLDTTLTALAAYNTNGLLTQTAADTFTGRTLTGPAAGITVSNGDGVAGNPTLALANDLAALEALAGTNTIYYRSGTDTWSGVTIGTGLTFTSGTLSASTAGAGTITMPQGRLTLQTATPVMTTTQSAKTTIYYTPYQGNSIPIYDGSNYTMTSFTEISVATTDTSKNPAAIGASKVNDWFVWNDSGTLRLTHGPDWTNDTTRSAGTALTLVNGIYLNNASITNGPAASRGTWVGTTRSNASSQLDWIFGGTGATGVAAVLGVWNAYNRIGVTAFSCDSTSSWTYKGTVRAANGSNNNRLSLVCGANEDACTVSYTVPVIAGAASDVSIAIGYDTTSSAARVITWSNSTAATNTTYVELMASQQLGFHFYQAVEFTLSPTNNATFFGQILSAQTQALQGIFQM